MQHAPGCMGPHVHGVSRVNSVDNPFQPAEIIVLAGTAGPVRMTPPTSTKSLRVPDVFRISFTREFVASAQEPWYTMLVTPPLEIRIPETLNAQY